MWRRKAGAAFRRRFHRRASKGGRTFAIVAQTWYATLMAKSYVGIIDEAGLRAFLREDPTVLDYVAALQPAGAEAAVVCFRAVVSDEAAEAVRGDLARGDRFAALCLLEGAAWELEQLVGAAVTVPSGEAQNR